jgi:hypothetical protein
MKEQDVVVLLGLALRDGDRTIRDLERDLLIPRAGVHRALFRLEEAGLIDRHRRRVNVSRAEEFLVHAEKYVFPPRLGGETRGVPTAWAAPPLASILAEAEGLPPVWPDPEGDRRGIALEPLHASAPSLARRDPRLGEALALVDGLRIGDARVRGLATELLSERLDAGALRR